jgi:hypothetical protein
MRTDTSLPVPVQLICNHAIDEDTARYACHTIGSTVARAVHTVPHARVRVSDYSDERGPLIVAQANANLGFQQIRVQASSTSVRSAIELLDRRLCEHLRCSPDDHAAAATPPCGGIAAARRSIPKRQRRIMRTKRVALRSSTCDEAARTMAAMDYQFHLFIEYGSGCDSVLSLDPSQGYVLRQVVPHPDEVLAGCLPVVVSAEEAPRLTLRQAQDRLGDATAEFLFFCDEQTGRGCALYRRCDGHYGLLVPGDEEV